MSDEAATPPEPHRGTRQRAEPERGTRARGVAAAGSRPTSVKGDPVRQTQQRGFGAVRNTGEPAPYISANLPPVLADEFEPLREAGKGGQAALLLCSRRSRPHELVVIKLYNAGTGNDDDPREAFRALSPEHAVPYVDPGFGQFEGRWWEVLEYLPEGSLQDYLAEHTTMSSDQLRQFITSVTSAIEHVHGQKPSIIHRDIKPGNLLIRSTDPFQFVLADFGIAVLTEQAHERHSGTRTDEYAAPEAPWGDTHPSLDWWSFGMTIAEVALGHHPYAYNGTLLSRRAIASEISTRPVPLDGIEDERLLLLLRGLLTRDPDRRWTGVQVRRWLAGESPEVATELGASSSATGPAPRVRPFPFARTNYTDPALLGSAILENWDAAARLIAGQELEQLVDWVAECAPDRDISSVATRGGDRVDAMVARIGARLNPDARPFFRGEPVDAAALSTWAARLSDEPALADVVTRLFDSPVLFELARLTRHENLGLIDRQWREFVDSARGWIRQRTSARDLRDDQAAVIDGAELKALLLRSAVERVASS